MAVLGERGVLMLDFGFATPKRCILAQNRVFWRILRRCPWWRFGCRWLIEPKNSRINNRREVAHAWKRNSLFELDEILQNDRYPQHNRLYKCWWRSVKGLRGGGGSKCALLHWLWSSPLQHSPTTVRVCDLSYQMLHRHNTTSRLVLSSTEYLGIWRIPRQQYWNGYPGTRN